MKGALAERLLAKVMGWDNAQVTTELRYLVAMAEYKYDQYEQFHPGLHFIESLALWLKQFEEGQHREIAYAFVREQLLFCSEGELAHFINMAYPDHIRKRLIASAAGEADLPTTAVSRVVSSNEFRRAMKSTLFLGLSDGARIDNFRRANPELSNEQIYPLYELTPERADEMRNVPREATGDPDARYRTLVLLDDFTASGTTYIREGTNKLDGKIPRAWRTALERGLITEQAELDIVVYVATERALTYIAERAVQLVADPSKLGVETIQLLSSEVEVAATDAFYELTDKYYDSSFESSHTKVGGTQEVKRGYSDCALPLALAHNSPNNSVVLLWAGNREASIRGLFPRVERHKDSA